MADALGKDDGEPSYAGVTMARFKTVIWEAEAPAEPTLPTRSSWQETCPGLEVRTESGVWLSTCPHYGARTSAAPSFDYHRNLLGGKDLVGTSGSRREPGNREEMAEKLAARRESRSIRAIVFARIR